MRFMFHKNEFISSSGTGTLTLAVHIACMTSTLSTVCKIYFSFKDKITVPSESSIMRKGCMTQIATVHPVFKWQEFNLHTVDMGIRCVAGEGASTHIASADVCPGFIYLLLLVFFFRVEFH